MPPRPSRSAASGRAARATTASTTRSRVGVRTGDPRVDRSSGLPRRGAVLPSLGGNRISTRARVGASVAPALARVLGMPSNRVITVRTGDDSVSAETLREGIAAIQAEMKVTSGVPRGRGTRRCRGRRQPTAAGPRPDRRAVRDHRPGLGARPRPGDAHRARRRRVRRALRDRRPERLHHPRRPGRRGGQPAGGDALRRGLQDPAAPDRHLRGGRLAAARRGAAGPGLDDPRRRDRGGHRRGRRARPGALTGQARLRHPAGAARRRHGRRDVHPAEGGRRAAAGPGGRARRGVPAAARAGDHRRGRPVAPGVPHDAPRRDAGTRRSRCSPASPRPR